MVRIANTLVSFRGVFGAPGSPAEEWQFGLRLTRDPAWDVYTEAQFQLLSDQAATVWSTTVREMAPSWVTLTEARVALIGLDGKTDRRLDGSFKQGVTSSALVGMHPGTVRYPLSVACVGSLMTDRQGATGKGRIFLPAPPLALDAEFLISEGAASDVANSVADLVSGLNALGAGYVAVFSTKGYESRVVGTRCGRVLDTMRSRRRSQAEGYVENTVPISA